MKKIVLSVICMFFLFGMIGCGNKNVGDTTENEVSKAEEALIEDGYVPFEENIDIELFKDISYVISNPFTYTTLVIKSDGSMLKYNLFKKFSNHSNIIKYESKIHNGVLLGLGSESTSPSDDVYWIFDKNKELYRFDSTTDQLSIENDLDVNVVFRGNEFDDAFKKISFDSVFKQNKDRIYLLKENKLYNFNYVGIYENNVDPFMDNNQYLLNIDLDSEKIEYMDQDFLKTDKNYYAYQYVESKYADQESSNQYVKLKVNQYKEDILYMNDSIAVLKNGKVYKH